MIEPRIIDYCWEQYNFGAKVADILQVEDLTALHGPDFGVPDTVTRSTDQSSILHKRFYEAFEQRLTRSYVPFVRSMAWRIFPGQTVYYQAIPTFRIQFPDNMAVGETHRDADYHHQQGARNLWVPLTPAFDTNTVWIEEWLGSGVLRPWNLQPGQALAFDGVNWTHGNQPNRTGYSRVSFDLRLITAKRYSDTGARSVNTGRSLALGDYYARLP